MSPTLAEPQRTSRRPERCAFVLEPSEATSERPGTALDHSSTLAGSADRAHDVVGAATIPPVGANVSALRVTRERTTASRHSPW